MLLMGAGLATLPMATIHAQTKKTNKSAVVRGKKKTTTPKAKAKTTQSATSKSAKTASPVSGGIFEGSLLYRSEEYHSAIVRKFSYGRAYNGARTTIVTVKGKAVHILDEPMHLHTIVNMDNNTVYMYSDLTKSGFKGTTKDLEAFINVYDPDYQIGDQKKVSTLSLTNEKATLDNQKCSIYRGDVTIGDINRLDVEMWLWDKYKVTKAYNYLLFGIPVPGIVRKGIYSQIGSVPLLGKMKSMVAMELVAYSAYRVNASDMLPPSSVTIETYKDNKQLTRLYKDNRKQLKKLKLSPESKSKKETMRNIRDRWDFADDWLRKPVSTENNAIAWRTLGNSLLEIANTFSSNGKDQPSALPTARDDGGDNMAYNDDYDDADDSKTKTRKNKEKSEETKKKIKQGEFAARSMKSSSRTYGSYVNTIIGLKTQTIMRGRSFDEKKKEVKNCQDYMKQIRERYEAGSGQKLPGANEQLERWNPSPSDLMEKCNACGGDGKCSDCEHKGNRKCRYCGGKINVSKTKEWETCVNCHNGKCRTCDGTGKCQKCEGRGDF